MILNYLITKIDAHRETDVQSEKQVGIAHNIAITDVKKDDRFNVLKFLFRFTAAFNFSEDKSKELGNIVLEGQLIYTSDNIGKVYKTWEESKVVDKSVAQEVVQASLNISIIEAMGVAKTMQLPSVLPLPQVSTENAEAAEEEKSDKKKSK